MEPLGITIELKTLFCDIQPTSKKNKSFFLETLEVILTQIRSFNGDNIIVGDFNVDINKHSAFYRKYCQLLLSFKFEPQNSHSISVRENYHVSIMYRSYNSGSRTRNSYCD